MKKISSALFLAGAVTIGLASCNKNQTPEDTPDLSGTTHGVVTAQLVRSGNSLKALTNGQQDVAGHPDTGEDKVSGGYLFFKDIPSVDLQMTQDGTTKTLYQSQIFTTSPNSEAHATLILNKSIPLSFTDYSKERVVELKDIQNFIKSDGFMMTSTIEDGTKNKLNIEANKKEADVQTGANTFTFDVERVVAKLQVTKKSSLDIDKDLQAKGDVDQNITFSMAGSALSTYLFADRAGSRTLSNGAADVNHVYKDFISVIDKEETPTLQKVSDNVASNYYVTPKTVTSPATDKQSMKADEAFYFFENSRYGQDPLPTAKGVIQYKRIVYAKVYSKFTVKKGLKVKKIKSDSYSYKTEELVEAEATDFSKAREYWVPVTEDWYTANKDKAEFKDRFKKVDAVMDPDGTKVLRPEFHAFQVKDKENTFYVGADNRIYDTQLAAAAAGNKTYKKYDGGKMVYMTPANTQKAQDGDLINYCDTRRNNIYDLKVTGFVDLGLNYDPVDPEDPNIPQPMDNPNEPKPDPNKPVQEEKTAMMVKAQILLWNLVDREVKLGEEL